jgi:hypothetical protein
VGFPLNPWDSLSPENQAVFWAQPGADYLEAGYQTNEAQSFYAVGFGFTADDYDRMGIDPDGVRNARDEYFDLMGMEWEDFDWDAWRDAMGYNED